MDQKVLIKLESIIQAHREKAIIARQKARNIPNDFPNQKEEVIAFAIANEIAITGIEIFIAQQAMAEV